MTAEASIGPPRPLEAAHDVAAFNSGVPSLDDWLKRRALVNQASGASRTFVVTVGPRVIAYYAISSGSIRVAEAPGRFRRTMPDPIPLALLGRLAVDRDWQGQTLGRALVQDCARRVQQAAGVLGIRGIAVTAISDQAKSFYEAVGFVPSLADPMVLVVTLADIGPHEPRHQWFPTRRTTG